LAQGHIRRALGLPWRTHSALLALVTGTLPLMDEMLCRTAMFMSKCLTTSDNSLVNFVARHNVYVLRQNSPVGRNALWCCVRFGLKRRNLLTVTLCPVPFLQNCMRIMWLTVLSMMNVNKMLSYRRENARC